MAYSRSEHEFFSSRLFLSNHFFKPYVDTSDLAYGMRKPLTEPVRSACFGVGLLANSLLMFLNDGLNLPSELAEGDQLLTMLWVLAIAATINVLPGLLGVYMGILLIDNPMISLQFAMGIASLANIVVSPVLNTLEFISRVPATLMTESLNGSHCFSAMDDEFTNASRFSSQR